MSNSPIAVIEEKLGDFFTKIPSLPSDLKTLLVTYLPYISVATGVLTVFNSGILNLLNLGWRPVFLENKAFPFNYYMFILFELIIGIILITAFKPLESRSIKGWRLLLYATLISFFPALILGLMGEIVVIMITFYLLFQVRESYS